MPKIKGIFFDMDGVLIDAREWHYEALNQALRLFSFEVERYDHLVTYDGLPTKKKLEMLSLEKGLPRALHPFINKLKQEYTFELIQSRCKPSFNHRFALSSLSREGYVLGVCSNSIKKTVITMLERANILNYFKINLSNEEVTNPKPHPEIYNKAIELARLEPKQCLILEDNQHGIAAAEASGSHVMHIGTPDDVTYENIHSHIQIIEQGDRR